MDQVLRCSLTLNIKNLVHEIQYAGRICIASHLALYYVCNGNPDSFEVLKLTIWRYTAVMCGY